MSGKQFVLHPTLPPLSHFSLSALTLSPHFIEQTEGTNNYFVQEKPGTILHLSHPTLFPLSHSSSGVRIESPQTAVQELKL